MILPAAHANLVLRICLRSHSLEGSACRAIIVCLLFLFGAPSPPAYAAELGERERIFFHALELFDNASKPEDYRASAQELESIVADGFQNGAVHYNIGNAYFRAGDYGRAILNYRKAKSLRPRDTYLEANLQQALAAAPGRLAEPPAPWWTHVLFWTEWISFPQKIKLTSLGFMLAAVITVIAISLQQARMHVVAIGLLFLSAALGIDVVLSDPNAMSRAVIISETIARKGTGKDYEPAFDQPLRDGAEFSVLNQTADWTFGHFEGIGDGWVRSEFVAR